MKITVHNRNQIGGCVTEIESKNGTRILIDVGSNLPGRISPEVPVKTLTKDCAGVFITHYHGDHVGKFDEVDSSTPIYMGEIAHEIFLNLCEHLPDKDVDAVKGFITFQARDKIIAGDMVITPFRVDHSAYDSYMFLIKCDGKKILHTGDFRTHGWTGKGVEALLRTFVRKVDVLICEGTMLSRQGEELLTEFGLYEKAKEILRENRNVFVLCSSTNIDTIASFYKAAGELKPKKLVVADKFMRLNMDIVTASAKSSIYRFPYVKIFWNGRQDCINEMRSRGFCMFVRPWGDKFKSIMKEFPDSLLVYSLWKGYLEGETLNNDIFDFIPKDIQGNPVYKYLHTGGHASEEAILSVCRITNPEIIIPIHSENPGRFEELKEENKGIIAGEIKRSKTVEIN